jgi:hypothetical protein
MPSSHRLSSFLFELIFVLLPFPLRLLDCELEPGFDEVDDSSSGTGLFQLHKTISSTYSH